MQEQYPSRAHDALASSAESPTARAYALIQQAKRVIDAAATQGVILRLFGGLAIWHRCPGSHAVQMRNSRSFSDIDLLGYLKSKERTETLFRELGYEADPVLATVPGLRRSMFFVPSGDVKFDVCYDVLEFCHVIDVRGRLEIGQVTVPLMELLIQKLQIVELTEKDLGDMQALLLAHPITSDEEGINGTLLVRMCCRDWGLCRTVTQNFHHMRDLTLLDSSLSREEKQVIVGRIEELDRQIGDTRKSVRWRLRAVVGTKIRWYTEVETPVPMQTEERRSC
jgi:hypothetical protein